MRVRRMTCMVVTKRSVTGGRDVQCGNPAARKTAHGDHPVCVEHAALSATETLTFDLGSSRLSLAVGAAMVDL